MCTAPALIGESDQQLGGQERAQGVQESYPRESRSTDRAQWCCGMGCEVGTAVGEAQIRAGVSGKGTVLQAARQ